MTMLRKFIPTLLLLPALACSMEGTVEVRAWGEDFIEQGIPAEELADGWMIEFERFEVTISDISIAESTLDDPAPVNLAEPSDGAGHELGRTLAPTGGYEDASFEITRVEVVGSASNAGGETKTFTWVFDEPTRYTDCETTTRVESEGVAEFQITVHADHLFYDSLVAEEPDLRFQPIADADADANGEVTAEELSAAGLGGYDPGNLAIDDLWSFLAAQAGSMGHIDGEGHCAGSPG